MYFVNNKYFINNKHFVTNKHLVKNMDTPAEVAAGVVDWLTARQLPSGAIRGENAKESPGDHYAHSFAALAMALLAEREGRFALWSSAEQAVRYTLSLPPTMRHQQEFNSLALLLITACVRESDTAPEGLRALLEAAIRDSAFLYDGGRQVSNNWLAMRAVCFLLRDHLIGDEPSRLRGEALILQTLGWQLPDGIFVDYPGHRGRAFATPLTYHAKMCAMLALAADYTEMAAVLPALERGLNALVALMSPRGECLYYGRSCNSLFGLAAACYALQAAETREGIGRWTAAIERIQDQIATRCETDGHLRLTPGHKEDRREGWDLYYHTEVYNAYAAAFLLLAPHGLLAPHRAPVPPKHNVDMPECNHLEDAGLLAIRGPCLFVALSTRGQCVLDGSSLFCDMRYSGLQPLLIELANTPQVPEPPLHWRGAATKAQSVSPRDIGFVPHIAWNRRDYCARVFAQSAVSTGEGWVLAWGRGTAESLELPRRWLRLARRIRAKLTGMGDPAFTPLRLPGVTLARAIFVFPAHGALLFVDGYEGVWPAGAEWHGPNARLLPAAALTVTSLVGPPLTPMLQPVPTSRGEAILWTSVPTRSPAPGCVQAYACGPPDMRITVALEQGSDLQICIQEIRLCLNLCTGQIQHR